MFFFKAKKRWDLGPHITQVKERILSTWFKIALHSGSANRGFPGSWRAALSYYICVLLHLCLHLFAKKNTGRHGRLEGLRLVCCLLGSGGELAKTWLKIFLAVLLLISLICSKLNSGTAVCWALRHKLPDQGLFGLVQSVPEYFGV